jgi:6-pyruvoyltetrahydropterin/6-carboxytetrahydropterin synthase
VDEVVRRAVIPIVSERVRVNQFGGGAGTLVSAADVLRRAFPGLSLDAVKLYLSPFLALEVHPSELPMVRLSQRFEFSASHRLHNPSLSDDENRAKFGKCNNPHGHGHNYELQVTLAGEPDADGVVIDVPAMERVVATTVIGRFDHKNLNAETSEFRDLIPSVENIAMVIYLIPSVENIAMVIYRLLRPAFEGERARLASVTVWETPKTWCEYSE